MRDRGRGKGKNRLPPFVPTFLEEMDSQAFQELTGTAVKALLYFKRIDGKLKGKSKGTYNGLFDLTYSEMMKYGFAKSTFSRVINELNEKGFITVVIAGGMRGAGRSNSKYQLSDGWKLYGQRVGGRPLFQAKSRYPTEP